MLCCRHLRLALTLLALGAGAKGAESAWPVVAGEVSGTLKMPRLASAPPVEWRVNAQNGPAGLVLDLAATAPGLALRVEATPPVVDADGTWRVLSGSADVVACWPVVLAQGWGNFLPADAVLAGTVNFTGAGTWRGEVFSGTISATLSGASVRSAAQSWAVDGITLDCELKLAGGKVTLHSAQLQAATIQAAGLTARKFLVDLVGGDDGRLGVRRAEVNALSGRIALAPFTLDPASPAVHTSAEISGVALADLAALVPQALAEASGQVAGRVAVNWSLAGGLEPGTGSLGVVADSPAGLRLTNSPGLLTGRATPKIEFLPGWTGPLRHWLSMENPAYAVLRQIERGEMPLIVEKLSVKLYPDGFDAPQSARVEVAARPTAGSAVERVTFAVNVTGPLTEVLKLGFDDRAKVRVNAPK
jgi:hypothetical protein